MSPGNQAVFLSYASQDAEAAKRICDALRQAGVEVWFDQSELVGGDAWDQKIRKQIKDCALLIPIISAATQARTEGYFRLEWRLADQRTHLMAKGRPFLLPVVIDDTRDTDAHVPDSFTEVQWTRLPGGETPPVFVARVQKLLGGEAVGGALRPDSSEPSGRRVPPTTKPSRSWLIPAIIGVAALAGLTLWQPWKKSVPSVTGPATASLTEAQKLVAQARKIFDDGDELDRESLILTDDLVKRALVLDAAEPSAWLLGAQVSYFMVWQSFDMSEARMADLQRQAARARALAPESVPAQLAVANARVAVAYSNFRSASNRQDLAGVEQDLLALAERAPRDFQVQRTLGQTYRFLKRPDDALRALQRALEMSGGDPGVSADLSNVLMRRKRFAEAEATLTSALARRPTGRLLVFDVFVKTRWRGNLAGAQAALATWPGWLLREDRGAFVAWQTWLWSRQPDRALDVAQRLPRDYLHDVWFTGPRAVLTARAHEMAGHREAAQADWRTVVRLADQELAGSPDDVPAMFWKAWALSRLGDQTGAEAASTLLQQRVTTQTVFLNSTSLSLLWSTMGRTDLAAAHLRAGFGADDDTYAVTRAMLELDPAYEALRKDPQFAGLAAAALAPVPKPEDRGPSFAKATDGTQKTEVGVPIDQKSVAVLAFANLSDDKSNEYFSDGISEELLNVLAKVPGLKVSARTSAFYFKGKEVPIPEIAKQLGVAYVVEGSVRKAGDKVRITAQLIKADGGFHVWSDTFTRDLKDIFAVQDEIAGLIAQNLQLKIGVTTAKVPVDPEAFRLFLEGRRAWNKRTFAAMDEAEKLLSQAIARDPQFARALAALADVWWYRSHEVQNDPRKRTQQEMRAETEAWLARAMAVDPNLVEVYATRGALLSDEGNWPAAEASFQQALALNPNYASAHQWHGTTLMQSGEFERGLQELALAVQLDPLAPIITSNYGTFLAVARRYDEALVQADRLAAMAPDFEYGRFWRPHLLYRQGQREEALRQIRARLPEGKYDNVEMYFNDLALLAESGDREEVRRRLEQKTSVDPSVTQFAYPVFMALGKKPEALAGLEARQAHGLVDAVDPVWDAVRSSPEFLQVIEKMGIAASYRKAWTQVQVYQKHPGKS